MITTFLSAPFHEQFLLGYVGLFIFFVFIIELKYFCLRLEKKGGTWGLIAKMIFYPFGIVFLFADAGFNIVYLPVLYGELANKYGEGWLATSRLQWHKAQPGLYWQKRVSLFICDRFVDKVDPGHCTTSRWA